MPSPPIIVYRIGNFFYRNKLKPLAKLISWINRFLFAVWIPSSANIGKNFILGYWGLGVVIHSDTIIGNNCQVNQNVTIGRNFGDLKVPVFGDNIYIGAGSVVFGAIEVGNNVIIGANTVVNKSIPDNSIVVGNPFKIIGNTQGKSFKEFDLAKKMTKLKD